MRLTAVIPLQQANPITSGFPPVLMSLTISVFIPMAAMASIMKNLLTSFIGENADDGTPKATDIVVMTDAPRK